MRFQNERVPIPSSRFSFSHFWLAGFVSHYGAGLQVKQLHPDVTRGGEKSDIMIRRVIQAYEVIVCINLFPTELNLLVWDESSLVYVFITCLHCVV